MTVYVGTSGFSYPEWVGVIYPPGTPTGKMLETYSGMFDAVEINATFYRPPGSKTFERYPERTGGHLKIAVKLHSTFTHERTADREDAKDFKEAVEPLEESGQFVGYLAQFPQSFHHTAQAREHVEKLRGLFPDAPLVCEFRHRSWWRRDVLEFLKELGVSMSSVDAPEIPALPPRAATFTAEPGYVRLHGRNKDEWYEGREPRYTYKYDSEALKEWLAKVKKLVVKSRTVLIFFNNHPFGYSAMDAGEFLNLLREAMPDALPPPRSPGKADTEQGILF
jgi:uncharacterized protein YecE (DUF72 family)